MLLRDLTPAKVEAWAAEQAKTRPTWARLCWRCLKVFLNWCAEHPDYSRLLVTANPAKTKRTRALAMDDQNTHRRARITAGLEGMTLHGLRRSFATLTEWLEVPTGVVAQIQGHKPSATAEKHYKRSPLDLLRVHHEKIEAWVLEQAGVQFDAKAGPGKLRVVTSQ